MTSRVLFNKKKTLLLFPYQKTSIFTKAFNIKLSLILHNNLSLIFESKIMSRSNQESKGAVSAQSQANQLNKNSALSFPAILENGTLRKEISTITVPTYNHVFKALFDIYNGKSKSHTDKVLNDLANALAQLPDAESRQRVVFSWLNYHTVVKLSDTPSAVLCLEFLLENDSKVLQDLMVHFGAFEKKQIISLLRQVQSRNSALSNKIKSFAESIQLNKKEEVEDDAQSVSSNLSLVRTVPGKKEVEQEIDWDARSVHSTHSAQSQLTTYSKLSDLIDIEAESTFKSKRARNFQPSNIDLNGDKGFTYNPNHSLVPPSLSSLPNLSLMPNLRVMEPVLHQVSSFSSSASFTAFLPTEAQSQSPQPKQIKRKREEGEQEEEQLPTSNAPPVDPQLADDTVSVYSQSAAPRGFSFIDSTGKAAPELVDLTNDDTVSESFNFGSKG